MKPSNDPWDKYDKPANQCLASCCVFPVEDAFKDYHKAFTEYSRISFSGESFVIINNNNIEKFMSFKACKKEGTLTVKVSYSDIELPYDYHHYDSYEFKVVINNFEIIVNSLWEIPSFLYYCCGVTSFKIEGLEDIKFV